MADIELMAAEIIRDHRSKSDIIVDQENAGHGVFD
jgi:hypothetical protein